MHESLDAALEVKSIFLKVSKAFDKVWHEEVLLKLKRKLWETCQGF